jgi:hypothetical protein
MQTVKGKQKVNRKTYARCQHSLTANPPPCPRQFIIISSLRYARLCPHTRSALVAAVICSACRNIIRKLPVASKSTASGHGMRYFKPDVANTIRVRPSLHDGTRAAFVTRDDVCATLLDADDVHVPARVHVQPGREPNVIVQYTHSAPKKLRVRVRVCGVLLVDVSVLPNNLHTLTFGFWFNQEICVGTSSI